jgi:hypothetical protein
MYTRLLNQVWRKAMVKVEKVFCAIVVMLCVLTLWSPPALGVTQVQLAMITCIATVAWLAVLTVSVISKSAALSRR